ncbi:ubiquitin-like protein [Encephalitozoon intestinalis ATCC 50506]|uniref:Ubiquitin-like protein n=1 Tax=Encephalitozoon intestinalis (strain ATCC 50506) TaxID=876142 RepID=E0S7Y9_ENCIT|nr:ubiquitin-like protein [Encephalitozoon intestinalis ATCC 50506]ADM11824.1 ubiquitin-like protein [Encephalitozoon intestinalis ATCC 50506]UTX45574.1 ubiquitin-like protein SMT3 [Encephalitozoon intestinalis]
MGSPDSGNESKTKENIPQITSSEKMPLKLIDQDGTMLVFNVKPATTFKKILDAFSSNVGKNSSEFRLLFNGKNIDPGKTPGDLGFEGNEELEVVTSQVGG